MTTMPVTHVLALAAGNFRNTESALAAQSLGAALDVELAALASVTTCADLRALGHRIGAAAVHEYGSGRYYRAVRAWERDAMSQVRARAVALFPEDASLDWIADLRGPTTP